MLSVVKCLDPFIDSISVRRFYILKCPEKLSFLMLDACIVTL
ncbi:hypothetical protein SAMN05444064_101331 [Pseudomonas syringae]|nr:hypothetical protein SAMN05444514_101333 [Pseudomonas syringae]SFL40675.1 hypothetical protein SAMN05444064_101331 [Pseudomonas syringae]